MSQKCIDRLQRETRKDCGSGKYKYQFAVVRRQTDNSSFHAPESRVKALASIKDSRVLASFSKFQRHD